MGRVAKDSYVLLGMLSIAKGKRIGAVKKQSKKSEVHG